MGNKNLRRLRCLVTAQTMGNLGSWPRWTGAVMWAAW